MISICLPRFQTTFSILLLGLTIHSTQAVGPMPGIDSSSKFIVYYGPVNSTTRQQLKDFDVVVLEPNNCQPNHIAYLQNRGVTVLGYISIGEDAGTTALPGNGDGPVRYGSNGVEQVPNLPSGKQTASFYVDSEWNGSIYESDTDPDKNGVFGGFYVHPNEDWRWVINTQRIGGSVGLPSRTSWAGLGQIAGTRQSDSDTDKTNNFGFDGFFLDTIDTANAFDKVHGFYPWTAEEMKKTVEFIRNTFSTKIIMANRGLSFFNPEVYSNDFSVRAYDHRLTPYIDAVLFESYYLGSGTGATTINPSFPDHKHNYAPKMMAESERSDGFTVFSLDYQEARTNTLLDQAITETIERNGWVEYIAPNLFLNTIGTYVLNYLNSSPTADTAPPQWDSTGSAGFVTTDVSDRIGLQEIEVNPTPGEITLRWDVATDQSRALSYNLYQSGAGGSVTWSDVVFEINSDWALNPENAFAQQTTLSSLDAGTYTFWLRAEDKLGNEESNLEQLSVTLQHGAGISNPNPAITLDGNLSDWSSITSFGTDPADIAGSGNQVDWLQAWMAHDANNLYLAYSNDGSVNFNWGFQLFLDTDDNVSTGFKGTSGNFPTGTEYMIQGYFLYAYTGSGTNWSWNFVGQLGRAWSNGSVELFLPRSWLNNPSVLNLFFDGDNNAYGFSTHDYYPDDVFSANHFFTYRF